MRTTRGRVLGASALVLVVFWMMWLGVRTRRRATTGGAGVPVARPVTPSEEQAATQSEDPNALTTVYAHNIVLEKGPQFRVYVRWIRGEMLPTHAGVPESLDDPDSFVLEIQKGVIHANIDDIANFLNANAPKDAPLKSISIEPDGDRVKLKGMLHRIIPLPVQLEGKLSPLADGRVLFHVDKIDLLKIPMKGLLGGMHVTLSDVVHTSGVPGVQVSGNDIYFDTQRLLPPPHIHGPITSVRVAAPDVEVVYGGVQNEEGELSQWHNFLRLRGGTLRFGKLTMRPANLTMIDASKDAWFDLDLVNYKAQLVNGYLRMTTQGGLEIYMAEATTKGAQKKLAPGLTVDWLKNRNAKMPVDVPVKGQPPEH